MPHQLRQRAKQFNGVYLKNLADNFFQIFFMGTSWVALSITNIKTRASREMTSRKNIKMFDFNGGECFQALACGRARYLPSLIALLLQDIHSHVCYNNTNKHIHTHWDRLIIIQINTFIHIGTD